MPIFNIKTAIIEINILILNLLLPFPKYFSHHCLVLRYVDEQVYCFDQCSSKWPIGTSKAEMLNLLLVAGHIYVGKFTAGRNRICNQNDVEFKLT